jgi:pimeloyl-ACP methyl ester carboxylesterase
MSKKIPLFLILPFTYVITFAANLPSIPDTIIIRQWLVCGPFSVGTREGITEAVEDPATLKPKPDDSLNSGLVQGGFARWRQVSIDSAGWLNAEYPDVRWDTIQKYYGISGLAAVGYACAEFYSPKKSRALAIATRIGSFIINGLSYLGDVYGNNWFQTPVLIDSGINRVILRLSGYADQRVRFLLIPVSAPLISVTSDITAPDIIAETETRGWLGIPLLNTTENLLNNVHLHLTLLPRHYERSETKSSFSVIARSDSDEAIPIADTTISNIPALGVKKPAIPVQFPALPYDTAGYYLIITARTGDFQHSDTIELRSRLITQPHKRTFLSAIDSSAQYYAITYPADYQPDRTYALILSLHGAGVEASDLAGCYKPKDWAFIVCPTNRRPYGFDWQDWGRLDAFEVLQQVCAAFPIDTDRIYLTGHSMGGHGTWYIGLTSPDRFAAIAPAAAWPSFPLYVPNFLQRTIIFSEPSKLAIRDMAARPDNVPALVDNALNLPVFILHGGDDDNVPPIHSRTFALWLNALGYQYRYKEVPEVKHWWNYPDGTVCVDDQELISFLKEKRRINAPMHIRFRTADLAQSNRAYWLTINRVRTVGRDATIEAFATDSLIDIHTSNITRLTLNLDRLNLHSPTVKLKIDGRVIRGKFKTSRPVTVQLDRTGWNAGTRGKNNQPGKKPETYGPAKQVMFSPFAVVYGTKDPELTGFLRHSATQECLRWWLIGNGTAEVYPDTGGVPMERNLIVLGSPDQNAVAERIINRLPVRTRQGRIFVNETDLGEHLAAIVTYPNPLNPQRLVLCRFGTDPAATRLSLFWGIIGSGTSVPDFMVFDRSVRKFGWHGIRAAGFFSPEWQIDPASCFIER